MSNSNLQEQLKICREITDELRRYPGAALFNEPVSTDPSAMPNYFKKVKNPQDLGTILERLDKGEYTDIKAWERDVNTVWQNAELYNGKDSYVSLIAHHMTTHFQKLKRRLEKKKISGWMKFLYLSREKLDRLFLAPPAAVGTIFPIRRATNNEMEYAPFSSRELDCLVEASEFMVKQDDLLQITKILNIDKLVPNGVDNLEINVDQISPKALHMLRDYFKKRLHQQGSEYPA